MSSKYGKYDVGDVLVDFDKARVQRVIAIVSSRNNDLRFGTAAYICELVQGAPLKKPEKYYQYWADAELVQGEVKGDKSNLIVTPVTASVCRLSEVVKILVNWDCMGTTLHLLRSQHGHVMLKVYDGDDSVGQPGSEAAWGSAGWEGDKELLDYPPRGDDTPYLCRFASYLVHNTQSKIQEIAK